MAIITNRYLREELTSRGLNPDQPGLADELLRRGYSPIELGRQPDEGVKGDIAAFLTGGARGLANTAIGVADIPFALARMTGATSYGLNALPPSYTEQANPNFSGLGQLGGFIGSALVPELAIGKLASATEGLGAVGRATEGLASLGEKAVAAERGERFASAASRLGGLPSTLATRTLSGAPLEAETFLSEYGLSSAAPQTVREGLLGGLSPQAMAYRALKTGTTFAAVNALQPGDVEDRLKSAFEGFTTGAAFGAFAAPTGSGRLLAAVRDIPAGIIGGSPISIPGLPSPVSGALFGAAFGALQADPARTRELKEKARENARQSVADTPVGGMPVRSDIPPELSGRQLEIWRTLTGERDPALLNSMRLYKDLKENYEQLTPDQKKYVDQLDATINKGSQEPGETPSPTRSFTQPSPGDPLIPPALPPSPPDTTPPPSRIAFEQLPLPGMSPQLRPPTPQDSIPPPSSPAYIQGKDGRTLISTRSFNYDFALLHETATGERDTQSTIHSPDGTLILPSSPTSLWTAMQNLRSAVNVFPTQMLDAVNRALNRSTLLFHINPASTGVSPGLDDFIYIKTTVATLGESLPETLAHEMTHLLFETSTPEQRLRLAADAGAQVTAKPEDAIIFGQTMAEHMRSGLMSTGMSSDGETYLYAFYNPDGSIRGAAASYDEAGHAVTITTTSPDLLRQLQARQVSTENASAARAVYAFSRARGEFLNILMESFMGDPDSFIKWNPQGARSIADYLSSRTGVSPVELASMLSVPHLQDQLLLRFSDYGLNKVEFTGFARQTPEGNIRPLIIPSTFLDTPSSTTPLRNTAILTGVTRPVTPHEAATLLSNLPSSPSLEFARKKFGTGEEKPRKKKGEKATAEGLERIPIPQPDGSTIEGIVLPSPTASLFSRLGKEGLEVEVGPSYKVIVPASVIKDGLTPLTPVMIRWESGPRAGQLDPALYDRYRSDQLAQVYLVAKDYIRRSFGMGPELADETLSYFKKIALDKSSTSRLNSYLNNLTQDPFAPHPFNISAYSHEMSLARLFATNPFASTYKSPLVDALAGPNDPVKTEWSWTEIRALDSMRRIFSRLGADIDDPTLVKALREGLPATPTNTEIAPIDPRLPDITPSGPLDPRTERPIDPTTNTPSPLSIAEIRDLLRSHNENTSPEQPDFLPTLNYRRPTLEDAVLAKIAKERGEDGHAAVKSLASSQQTISPPPATKIRPTVGMKEAADLVEWLGPDTEIGRAEAWAARAGTSTAVIDHAFSIAKDMGSSRSTIGIAQQLTDLGVPSPYSWSAARIVMDNLKPSQRKVLSRSTMPDWVAERVLGEVKRPKKSQLPSGHPTPLPPAPEVPSVSTSTPLLTSPVPSPEPTPAPVISQAQTESPKVAETTKKYPASQISDSVKKWATQLSFTLRRLQGAAWTKFQKQEEQRVQDTQDRLTFHTDLLTKDMARLDAMKTTLSNPKLTVRNRTNIANAMARLTDKVNNRVDEIQKLSTDVTKRQVTSALTRFYSSDPKVHERALTLERLTEIQDRTIRDAEDKREVPANYASAVRVDLAKEAFSQYGSPHMDAIHFASLPKDMQLLHIAYAISHPDLDLKTVGTSTKLPGRWDWLNRFISADPKTRQDAYPYMTELVKEKEGRLAQRALRNVTTRLDGEGATKPSFTFENPFYSGSGSILRSVNVKDEMTGRVYRFKSFEGAALGLDLLTQARAQAPSLDPPGLNFMAKLIGGFGPRPARITPTDTIDGEDYGVIPPSPTGGGFHPLDIEPENPSNPKARPIISIGRVPMFLGNIVTNAPKIDRAFFKATGKQLGLTPLMNALMDRYKLFRFFGKKDVDEVVNLMSGQKISRTYQRGVVLDRVARTVDNYLNTVQKKFGPDAARLEQPLVEQEISLMNGLTDGERNFLFGDSTSSTPEGQGGMREWWKRKYNEKGLTGAEEQVGYYPRSLLASKGVTDRDEVGDVFTRDLFDSTILRKRTRSEAMTNTERSDLIRRSILDESQMQENDYFATVTDWIRKSNRLKYMAEPVSDIQSLLEDNFGLTGDEASRASSPAILEIRLNNYLHRILERFLAVPSEQEIHRKSATGQLYTSTAAKIEGFLTDSRRATYPPSVVTGLDTLYKTLNLKATTGEVVSLLDTFTKLHRSSIFSLHLMRAVRDSVTTDLFFLYPRFDFLTFARAYRDVVFDPVKRAELVERYGLLHLLDDDEFRAFENEKAFAGKAFKKANEFATWMYRRNDTHTRVMAARLSELATEKAITRYQKTGDFGDFLEISGLDTHDKFVFDDATKREVEGMLKAGNHPELFRRVARIHQDGAVFNYLRPNAPIYYDSAVGRFLGQYGTWPANAINSLWKLYTAPLDHHEGNRGYRRAITSAVKYGVAAEAIYALGASFNVDTSNWIPFIHNTALGFSGGPGLSLYNRVSDLAGGDPQLAQELARHPGRVLMNTALMAVPIPGSDTMKRLVSQTYSTGDGVSRAFGLPEMQSNIWDRMIVGAGFTPNQGLRPSKQRAFFPIKRLLTYGPAELQNQISGVTGLPPTDIQEQGYKPILGGE